MGGSSTTTSLLYDVRRTGTCLRWEVRPYTSYLSITELGALIPVNKVRGPNGVTGGRRLARARRIQFPRAIPPHACNTRRADKRGGELLMCEQPFRSHVRNHLCYVHVPTEE